jgi:dihydroneopterin aldolase
MRPRGDGRHVARKLQFRADTQPPIREDSPMSTPLATAAADRPLARPAFEDALDLVFVDGLVVDTVIGIDPNELHLPQPLAIDVCAGVPRARACATDRIADTIDYGALRARLVRLAAEHRVQLLEALAEQVAHIALFEFGAHWVRVRVAKPRKFADTAAVGVMIERRRDVPPERPTLTLIGAGLVPGSLT